jgi:N-acetyl sugar amidotransferase
MRYCKKCVMPDTRPGITFDKEGVCEACRNVEKRKNINWNKRLEELKELCNKYRKNDGSYDCIIPVSGGKDSHFQIYVMKELMKMNPLLINVSNFDWTEAGRHNFNNMSETFGCDIISLHINRLLAKKMIRIAFEELGSPTWIWDRAVYVFPMRIAINFKIPLVVYGENISYEYGGFLKEETYSAKDQIKNDVVKPVPLELWLKRGIIKKELNNILTIAYPPVEEIEKAGIEPIYLSYFVPWDQYHNYEIARRYGFKNLSDEWDREGCIENFHQIDSVGYLVHPWLKYPKFGHARVTDVTSYLIRHGRMTRDEAIKLVKERDHILDQKSIEVFCEFTGYTVKEFWDIVEKFWNRKIFENVNGIWKLKDPIWEQNENKNRR